MSELIVKVSSLPVPALVASAGVRASVRILEYFKATIRNPNTRRSYWRSAGDFLGYCEQLGVSSINQVIPLHVAAWVETLCQSVSSLLLNCALRLCGIYWIGWAPAK